MEGFSAFLSVWQVNGLFIISPRLQWPIAALQEMGSDLIHEQKKCVCHHKFLTTYWCSQHNHCERLTALYGVR